MLNKIKLFIFKKKWKSHNKDNGTIPQNIFPIERVAVGRGSYGELNINIGTNKERKIKIGNYCSIGPGVRFIINPHNYRFFTTWPIQRHIFDEFNYEWETKTSIVVEDDVWIGQNAIILGGVILHQGCVIGAGSVVTHDIPPYAIYANGRIVKYRFSEYVCRRLNEIDYSLITNDTFLSIKGWHKQEIRDDNVDQLLAVLPRKRSS